LQIILKYNYIVDLGIQPADIRKDLLATKIPNLFSLKIVYFHMLNPDGIKKFLEDIVPDKIDKLSLVGNPRNKIKWEDDNINAL